MILRAASFAAFLALPLSAKEGAPKPPLSAAVQEKDIIRVKQLLSKGADPNQPDEEGTPPLYQAVQYRVPEIVTLLIDHGARLDTKADVYGGAQGTAFQESASNGDLEMAKLLVARGARVDTSAATVISAVASHSLDFVKFLEQHGASLLSGNNDDGDRQPIHAAADNPEMLIYVLSRGADPFAEDNVRMQPIHVAARSHCLAAVTLLLEKGADVNTVVRSNEDYFHNGRAPLHFAVETEAEPPADRRKSYRDLVALLLLKGADAKSVADDGATPLHLASDEGIISQLLGKGAEVSRPDKMGNQPIHSAAFNDNVSAIRLLRANGASIAPKNTESETPLDQAAFWSKKEAMEFLLDEGAKPTELTMISALHSGEIDTVPLLRKHGGKITAKVYLASHDARAKLLPFMDKETIAEISGAVLPEAAEKGDLALVKELIEAGAVVDATAPADGCCAEDAAKGTQAIHYAAALEDPAILTFLLKHGAKPDAATASGVRPLHIAAGMGMTGAVKRLLAAGADPSLKGPDDKTAAQFAEESGHKAISKLLADARKER
jgi:ankyrin repeat protein